ncbi:MAG TPA: hypothetical protein VFL90_21730 [Methylomirabilota bacterium]|nr:hypothetical protein [Methylomirabilota bacterium]
MARVPLLVLLAYGVAFAAAALGVATPAFDDHPGQLVRLWHVVTLGPAPWAWNPGWWTGYPELQFYPPAFAYAGAALHALSLGALSVGASYQTLLWLAYLAPGVTAYVALVALLGDGWLALPGAFLALTLSLWPGLASGVEGGVHVGMAPARLAWALLPLLVAALRGWAEGERAFPARTIVPLLAGLVLAHPAHLPGAVVVVLLAALARAPRGARLLTALAGLALAALLTAFWTLPLLARAGQTRALAWGDVTPGAMLGDHPLVVLVLAAAPLALFLARGAGERLVARLPWAIALVVAADALVLEPRGLRWLPADRVLDAGWLALVLAAGLASGRLIERLATARAIPAVAPALAAIAVAGAIALATDTLLAPRGTETLALWPRAHAWPSLADTERGLRLPTLWAALREAPPGRVLFVRSAVPLVYGTQWWRPHTHAPALTPLATGRGIVNGTFTHPSPVAALLYRGSTEAGAITRLVERLDGESLFGRPLQTLDAATLNDYTRGLGVSVIVALEDDLPRLPALTDNPLFRARRREGPFVLWLGPPASLPQATGPGRWTVTVTAPGDWTSAKVAYYPLWRAASGGRALPTRRGRFGQLEVRAPADSGAIELAYGPGAPELAGVVVSALGLLLWLGAAVYPLMAAAPASAHS